MIDQRMRKLLRGMAEDLDNLSTPLHHGFLVENEVTADECCQASQTAALILRGFLRAPETTQMAVFTLGAIGEDSALSSEAIVSAVEEVRSRSKLHALISRLDSL